MSANLSSLRRSYGEVVAVTEFGRRSPRKESRSVATHETDVGAIVHDDRFGHESGHTNGQQHDVGRSRGRLSDGTSEGGIEGNRDRFRNGRIDRQSLLDRKCRCPRRKAEHWREDNRPNCDTASPYRQAAKILHGNYRSRRRKREQRPERRRHPLQTSSGKGKRTATPAA